MQKFDLLHLEILAKQILIRCWLQYKEKFVKLVVMELLPTPFRIDAYYRNVMNKTAETATVENKMFIFFYISLWFGSYSVDEMHQSLWLKTTILILIHFVANKENIATQTVCRYWRKYFTLQTFTSSFCNLFAQNF